jgi:hydrogenase maturation protease
MDSGAELFLEEMTRSALQEVTIAGQVLRPGHRVRLQPRAGGDIIDAALAGRAAVIEGIDEDDTGEAHVAVILEDDPGRDLAQARHPAHRFFFAPHELVPLDPQEEAVPRRVLVAGIGNVFLGDDGFGVAVADLLAGRERPRGVEVRDYGIRGMDLAYALGAGYDAAILVDAVPRGGAPGTLYLIEPDAPDTDPVALDSHQMNPLAVLRLARQLGTLPPKVLIVGCEPQRLQDDEISMELTAAVSEAVERAAGMVMEVAGALLSGREIAATT